MEWNRVFAEASRLALAQTRSLGPRSLDIIHVAAALISESDFFVTFDGRQSKLAKAAGLKLVKI